MWWSWMRKPERLPTDRWHTEHYSMCGAAAATAAHDEGDRKPDVFQGEALVAIPLKLR